MTDARAQGDALGRAAGDLVAARAARGEEVVEPRAPLEVNPESLAEQPDEGSRHGPQKHGRVWTGAGLVLVAAVLTSLGVIALATRTGLGVGLLVAAAVVGLSGLGLLVAGRAFQDVR